MEHYYVKHKYTESQLIIELYQTKAHKDYTFKYVFHLFELRQIVKIIESDDNKTEKSNNESESDYGSKDIHSFVTLKELFISVYNGILTIEVGYSGPRIKIKLSPYLRSIFKKSINKLGSINKYRIAHFIKEKTKLLTVDFYKNNNRKCIMHLKFSKDDVKRILFDLNKCGYYSVNCTCYFTKHNVEINSQLIQNNTIIIFVSKQLKSVFKHAFKPSYKKYTPFPDDSDFGFDTDDDWGV